MLIIFLLDPAARAHQVTDDTPLDAARVQSCDLTVIVALFSAEHKDMRQCRNLTSTSSWNIQWCLYADLFLLT